MIKLTTYTYVYDKTFCLYLRWSSFVLLYTHVVAGMCASHRKIWERPNFYYADRVRNTFRCPSDISPYIFVLNLQIQNTWHISMNRHILVEEWIVLKIVQIGPLFRSLPIYKFEKSWYPEECRVLWITSLLIFIRRI